ncbi:MAG: hypothetical protein Aurels2KO_17240 [Aureliella sp.]
MHISARHIHHLAYSMLTVAALGCIALSPKSCAHGQESLRDQLDHLKEHRSGLQTYVAKITIASYSTNDYGPPVGIHRGFLIREIGVVADKTQDSVLSCSTSYSAESSPITPSKIILRQGDKFWVTSGRKFASVERSRADSLLEPDIIGLGFCAEIGRFTSFEKLVSGNIGAKLTLDKRRGYSPIQTGLNGYVSVRCEPTLTKEGLWLPQRAFYECNSDNGMYIHVEWLAINRPVSPLLLQPATIARLSGYEFQGTAAPAVSTKEIAKISVPANVSRESLRQSWGMLGTSYRDIYQQAWLSSQLGTLGIAGEAEAAHNFLNSHRIDFPDFNLLVKDTESVETYFASLAQRLAEANTVYRRAFQNNLSPEQHDAFIALYIRRNGLEAFANRAVQEHFTVSEEQVEALEKLLGERRAIARQNWADTSAYSEKDPNLSGLDFRAEATLSDTRIFLNAEQRWLLASLLSRAPKRVYQRLSLGF